MKGWSFGHISSEGHSGGLLTTWNQGYEEILVEKNSTMLKKNIKDKSIGAIFALYNVYEPYQE